MLSCLGCHYNTSNFPNSSCSLILLLHYLEAYKKDSIKKITPILSVDCSYYIEIKFLFDIEKKKIYKFIPLFVKKSLKVLAWSFVS